MNAPVLAVFSGTQLDPAPFQRALALALERNTPLVLLDVRHLQQADRLGEFLESESPLGRATVKALQLSVQQQRDRAIGQGLQSLTEGAHAAGVQVSVREEKGEYGDVVMRAVRELLPAVLVVSHRSPDVDMGSEVQIIRV